jgi:hypothetical protein
MARDHGASGRSQALRPVASPNIASIAAINPLNPKIHNAMIRDKFFVGFISVLFMIYLW